MEKWINLKMPSIERRKFQHSKNVLIFLKEKLDINAGEAILEKITVFETHFGTEQHCTQNHNLMKHISNTKTLCTQCI